MRRQLPREKTDYLGANIPQAWATGSIFLLLQTMLAIRADAPGNVLFLCGPCQRPALFDAKHHAPTSSGG